MGKGKRTQGTETMIEFSQTKAGDITIRIPRACIRHTVKILEDFPDGSRVTHTKTFSDAVLREMQQEEEDGTTLVHAMLDQAVIRAIEEGADGVKLAEDD